MPKYWIRCMSEDNDLIAQQQELIGLSERARTAIHKIAIGDMVAFHINKKKVDSLPNDPAQKVQPEAAKDQIIGSAWIGARHPVDLNTARGDDPVVPRLPDRRRRFEALAARLRPGTPVKILEGLFLEASREHLGLIAFECDGTAHIVGDRITVRHVPNRANTDSVG
jgi:hypothetical protein